MHLALALLSFAPTLAHADSRSMDPQMDDFAPTLQPEIAQEEEAEEETESFFREGRFFAVSFGFGHQGITGNRGKLWEGGFPAIDFKIYYWFSTRFSLALSAYWATYNYSFPTTADRHDVNMTQIGAEFRYSFDVKDATASISFANPFVAAGLGIYNVSDSSVALGGPPDRDSKPGISIGGGLEFEVKPRNVYIVTQFMLRRVVFKDDGDTTFATAGVPDLSGLFYTMTANLMFAF